MKKQFIVEWCYNERHQGKGAMDGVGRAIKNKVYRNVKSRRIHIKGAKSFAEYADITIRNIKHQLNQHRRSIACEDNSLVMESLKFFKMTLDKEPFCGHYYCNRSLWLSTLTVIVQYWQCVCRLQKPIPGQRGLAWMQNLQPLVSWTLFYGLIITFLQFQIFLNPLSVNLTKWSNTLKHSSAIWRRIVWVRLAILLNWHLKG